VGGGVQSCRGESIRINKSMQQSKMMIESKGQGSRWGGKDEEDESSKQLNISIVHR
jgi:hypothetical protein